MSFIVYIHDLLLDAVRFLTFSGDFDCGVLDGGRVLDSGRALASREGGACEGGGGGGGGQDEERESCREDSHGRA